MSVSSSEVGDRSLNHAVRQQKEAGRIQLHRTVCFLFFSSHFVSFRFHFSFCWFDRISDGLSVSVISVFDWNIVDSIVFFFGSVLEHGPLARVTSFSFSSFVSRTSLLVLARNRSSSFGWGLG